MIIRLRSQQLQEFFMGKVIAIANQKGGVGKTTTTVNLSACISSMGRRTLMIDMDPQSNATQGVGLDKNEVECGVYDIIVDRVPMEEAIRATEMENLWTVPTDRELVGAEVQLANAEKREYRLREALDAQRENYEYVFIDCPPSLGLLTLNSLVAADAVLVALQCEYYALEGLTELLGTITLVKKNFNPSLKVFGVLLTMYQHTNLSRQVVEDVRTHLGDKVFETIIPRNVTLSEAPSFGKPVMYYDLKSAGSQAYLALAEEVIARG